MENNDRKLKTTEERKQALEEALKRIRPAVKGTGSVNARVEKLANRKIDETENVKAKKKDTKPISLIDLAKKGEELKKKAEKAGIDLDKPTLAKDLDEKSKTNEKKKEKEKDKKKENSPEKQEQKIKEMFSKIKLPSGMEIHQEGPSWILVSKDGKQRTDVTDVMNTIDKFNRNVDAANEENRMQNNVQSGADKAVNASKKDMATDNGLNVNETNGKVKIIGDALPMVKDIEGNQVFKEEDIKAIAETAVKYTEEAKLLEDLKNPKALEEMRKREKRNEEKADIANQALALKNLQGRGGKS